MNFHDLTTAAYAKLHALFGANDTHLVIAFLGYEYPAGQTDFIYQWQEDDFTRELVNSFNQFAYWLLLRPGEVSSRIAHAAVLEVGNHALGRALQHVHVLVRRLA